MIAEVLATLAGHPSSLLLPLSSNQDPSSSSTLGPLHPGEVHILRSLANLARRYTRIKQFATSQLEIARRAALIRSNRYSSYSVNKRRPTTKSTPTRHLAPLCSTLLTILRAYQDLVLEVERAILSSDSELVGSGGFVSLSIIRSKFQEWETPLMALDNLVTELIQGPAGREKVGGREEGDEAGGETTAFTVASEDWTGGLLIDLLARNATTGVRSVSDCMGSLRDSVEESWSTGLVSWMCYGQASRDGFTKGYHHGPLAGGSAGDRDDLVEWVEWGKEDVEQRSRDHAHYHDRLDDDGLEMGGDWRFRPNSLPSSIPPSTRDSILYVGKALNKVRASSSSSSASSRNPDGSRQVTLPESMTLQHAQILDHPSSRPSSNPTSFSLAVKRIREDVSEWLFRNVLTTESVLGSIETMGDYFLHRNGAFCLSLLSEVEALRRRKLLTSRTPLGAMIRSSDLDLALHRASVGNQAEEDPNLENLKFVIGRRKGGGKGDRLSSKGRRWGGGGRGDVDKDHDDDDDPVRFDDLMTGFPVQLGYTAQFPLDLFLSRSELETYSELFSYLMAIRRTQSKVLETWVSISKSQRTRRKFTVTGEGGVDKREEDDRTKLLRLTWGLNRNMLWFLDTLLGHFQTDVIDVEFRGLISQLISDGGGDEVPQRDDDDDDDSDGDNEEERAGDAKEVDEDLTQTTLTTLSGGVESRLKKKPSNPSLMRSSLSRSVKSLNSSFSRQNRSTNPRRSPTTNHHHHHPEDSLMTDRERLSAALSKRFVAVGLKESLQSSGVSVTNEDGDEETNLGGVRSRSGVGGGIGTTKMMDPKLDFTSLRSRHSLYLESIVQGTLLDSPPALILLRKILESCQSFVNTIQKWNGDVLPSLLSEGSTSLELLYPRGEGAQGKIHYGKVVMERRGVIQSISEQLNSNLQDFFDLLCRPTKQEEASFRQVSDAQEDLETGRGGGRASPPPPPSSRLTTVELPRRRTTEQLLLRLDFNSNFFSPSQVPKV
ncbi:hypothetical protein IE53DRAFT_384863 [Violaceomyces palustris]|uniref:Uncharacterized protein n=1 Tax=Violaceomyces palustris TaxID=1673888 RepID=A0ACD0P3U0_9BASI|nr:hypothetical protein IE53DRAFT_384863 [Violaceomyces palustris]